MDKRVFSAPAVKDTNHFAPLQVLTEANFAHV